MNFFAEEREKSLNRKEFAEKRENSLNRNIINAEKMQKKKFEASLLALNRI